MFPLWNDYSPEQICTHIPVSPIYPLAVATLYSIEPNIRINGVLMVR